MFANTLKNGLGLTLAVALLAGCGSTPPQDTAATDPAADSSTTVTTDTADTSGVETTEAPDPMAGVDTVFYFDFDQSTLKSEARVALLAHASDLKANPRSVRLEGHADERGTREYNMALGERRAKSVRDFLVLQGVDGTLIETISYGEEYPAQTGSSESSYSLNRRVELK